MKNNVIIFNYINIILYIYNFKQFIKNKVQIAFTVFS